MTRAQKAKLLPEARKLYADGCNLTRICEELKIGSRSTLAKWMAEDGAAGTDWDELRKKKLASDPYAPVRAVRKRVEWLLEHQTEFLTDPGYDARLNYALLNQDRIEARYGSADRFQAVLEQLALWARSQLKPDEIKCAKCGSPHDPLAILHDISDRFMADLRRGELEIST